MLLKKLFYYIGSDKLHKATQAGDVKRMRSLIQRGADVNALGPQKATPLFFAANIGSVEAAKLLLANGASINHAFQEGGTALHSALMRQHEDLSHFLIDSGANIHKKTDSGVTPLHLAALSGLYAVLGRLLRAGADIHALTREGQGAVYCVLAGMTLRQSEDATCLRMLFDAGVDPRIGADVLEDNMVGFSEKSKQALRKELETLVAASGDPELKLFANRMTAAMSGRMHSPLLNNLSQSDDEDLADWWYSEPMAFPFWDNKKIPVAYVFTPHEDQNFVLAADAAIARFLKLTPEDRLDLTPLLEASREQSGANAYTDKDVWDCLTPPEVIQVHRRHRRDQDIYVQMGMNCAWEPEDGLQFVFRKGVRITRVSRQDGWLTEADAQDIPDREDALLSQFSKRPKRKAT